MNKKVKVFCSLVLILSIIILYFCTKNPASLSMNTNDIFGKWEWYKTIGVFPPIIITPPESGYARYYIFLKDSTYFEYENSEIIEQGNFSIREYPGFQGESSEIISFNDGLKISNYRNLSIHPDTLILRYHATDTPFEYFFRAK